MSYGVLLFHTTSATLRAEKVLKQAGMRVRLIPTPREFSSDCGIALRFEEAQGEAVCERLHQAGVEISGRYSLTGEG